MKFKGVGAHFKGRTKLFSFRKVAPADNSSPHGLQKKDEWSQHNIEETLPER